MTNFLDNIELANTIARRYLRRSIEFEELRQAAEIGLYKAALGFKLELGFKFAAYAYKTIVGEVKRHFRDYGWTVKINRKLQETYLLMNRTHDELAQTLGRKPTMQDTHII